MAGRKLWPPVYLKLKLKIYSGEAYKNRTESVCMSVACVYVCVCVCCGLNCVPPNSYVDVLTFRTSDVTVFRDKTCENVIKIKCSHWSVS